MLLANWPKPRVPSQSVAYLVLDGPYVAATAFVVPDTVAQGLTPRALIYTERPAYRPGQRVGLRGIVREVKDGQFDARPGASYRLEVLDSRGRRIVGREVTLSAFGTFHVEVPLDSSAPVGTYRVRVYQPDRSEFTASIEVQAYRLAKADLTVELPRTVFVRGEPIEGHAAARYPDGTPMAGQPVEVQLPDGRTLRGRTDAAGHFPFTMATEGFAKAQPLRIVARLPEDEVEAAAVAALAVLGFTIIPRPRAPSTSAASPSRSARHPRRHRQTDRPGAIRLGDQAYHDASRRDNAEPRLPMTTRRAALSAAPRRSAERSRSPALKMRSDERTDPGTGRVRHDQGR